MITYNADSLERLPEIGEKILKEAGENRLFALFGEMGAGKTTLINVILKVIGVEDKGSSPTFSLVNEYRTNSGEPIYHFDFYRIDSVEEVYDIGYEEYFFGGSYCFMEWPEKIEEILPDNVVKIGIEVEQNRRLIHLNLPD